MLKNVLNCKMINKYETSRAFELQNKRPFREPLSTNPLKYKYMILGVNFMNNLLNIIRNADNIMILFMEKENTKEEHKYYFKKALVSEDLYAKIREMYYDSLNNMTSGKSVEEFDPTVTLDNTYESLNIDKIPGFDYIKASINDTSVIDTIHDLKNIILNSTAYCFLFQYDSELVLTFKKITSSYSLKNKIPIFCSEGHITEIPQNIFSFDDKIDCIYFQNDLFIFSKFNFETIFSYKTAYYASAISALETLNQYGLINNYDEFKEECLKRSTIVKKFANIEKDKLVEDFRERIHQKTGINETISRFKLDVKINTQNQIEYDDVSTLSEIVNLILDNYLISLCTNDNYEARNKKKLV